MTAALDAGMEASGARRTNLASVDLNLLVALEALLEQRNVTHAGQRVGLSQPAMSRALARLRGMFNDDLLVRTSAGPTLTARGEQLRARLPSALGVIREILVSRSFRPEEAKSKVTVAMPEHQALVLLPRLLPRLRLRAPNLDLVVSPLLAGSLKRLESGEIDLAIGQVDGTPSGFFRRTLYTDRFVCLLRRDHPSLQHEWTADRFLALRHAVISPGAEGGFGQIYDAIANLNLPDRDPLIVPNVMAAPMMVAESDLVLTVPRRVAMRAAAMLPLTVVEPPVELPSYEVSLIWHERHHRDAEHGWTRSEIAAAATEVVHSLAEPPAARVA
ncbi:LysR family transcriptional regulator [Mycobacterium sp. KBS0706]|uniref:LysR family transcriptional regulator n=1 Tax=Mycobacterium sp. KBS0706 TaxID=2578109 RepID=UPI001C8F7241|nr:LysR family transcriptional regulator [Mycobacterium sp. KBS0706]